MRRADDERPAVAGSEVDRGLTALDDRQSSVLRAVVQQHIRTGEPVGSTSIAGGAGVKLSSASVRAVMAELAERGLLSQPHTSAGRVPTDEAYRYFVDRLLGRTRVDAESARTIENALEGAGADVGDLLEEASRQLSHFSHRVGLVLAPDLRRVQIDRLEFVRLDGARVVAILVARSGVVHQRMLRVDEPLEVDELDRCARWLTDEVGGRTLPEMRAIVAARLLDERAAYDRLMSRSLELGRRAVADVDDGEAQLFVEGASNLLDLPESADLDLLRALFRTLEDRRTLVDLLGRLLDGEGVRVVIGAENPLSDLGRCSLVASPYGSGRRVMGTVGIVGPTRMPYGRAIALVDHLAAVLTRILSGPEH